MSDILPPNGAIATGKELRQLLASRQVYKRRWMRYAQRMRSDEVNYAAVSQVVALYLWDQGLASDSDQELPRRLRDRVRQALRGEQLSCETLTWIVEAFEFDAVDSAKVWDAFAGESATNLNGKGIGFTLRNPPVPLIKPQQLRTVALFSRYYIGQDRMLNRIETSHVVVALEDGVDAYAYSPRDTVTDVAAISGGVFVGFHDSTPGFIGVEFRLDQPLRKGQQTSLQYFTSHRGTSEPCTHIRRAARKRMDNIDMRVIFDAACPEKAWWCAWDDYADGNIALNVPVKTSLQELHQFVPYAEHAVVGFRWNWLN